MLIVGLIIGLLMGHQIGCMWVGARMKQVAYLKHYEIAEHPLPHPWDDRVYPEGMFDGMRYLIEEVTHDDFYYSGERPGV